jgi:hypothetical protein
VPAALASLGGLLSLLFVPAVLRLGLGRGAFSSVGLGLGNRLSLLIVGTVAIAVSVRFMRGRGALDRSPPPLEAAAAALCMVPEAVWRWSLGERGACVWQGSVEGGAPAELHVGALPSPAVIRWLARRTPAATVFNLCCWWGGYARLSAELGVEVESLHTGEAYVVAQAEAVARRLRKGGVVHLHCETGASDS